MSGDLARKSVFNILWSYTSFIGTKVINLAAVIILARQLSPEAFGLMALCLVVIAYVEIFARFGLGQALVSWPGDWEEAASPVFFFSLLISASMATLLWLASPAIASYFDQPLLADMLPILSIGFVIQSLTTVHMNLLRRRLQFRKKTIPDISQSLIKGVVSIILALDGYGAWALVYGYLAGSIGEMVVRFWVCPWLPTRWPNLAIAWKMSNFGVFLLVAEMVNALQRTLDTLMISKILGPAAVGLYSHAFRIPELTIRSVNQVAGTVIHPIMSQMQDDMAALREYYYNCLRYVSLFSFTAGAALACLADPLVQVLYTPEWEAMIFPMQCLALSMGIMTTDFLPGVIYKAINKPRYMMLVSLLKLPFFVVTIWYFSRRGLNAVAAAQVFLAAFYVVLNFLMLRYVVAIEVRRYCVTLIQSVLIAVLVGVVGFLLLQLPTTPLVMLIMLILAMGAAFLGAVYLFRPEIFHEGRRMLVKKMN